MSNKALCIFHKGCMDGFSAAYVVGRFLGFENVEFLQQPYDKPIPDITDRNVYIVDFSYRPDVLLPVLDTAKSVVMLDHHKTAIEHWAGIIEKDNDALINDKLLFIHDISKSGVGITWDFFYPNHPLPPILAACQDYDLWKFKLPNTDEIVAALYSKNLIREYKFQEFGDIVNASSHHDLVTTGKVIRSYQKDMATNIGKRCAFRANVLGFDVPVCPMPRELHSMGGHILAEGEPFSITYEDLLSEGVRTYSLRSCEGGEDVAKIAQTLKPEGGGHARAAGFSITLALGDVGDPLSILFTDPASLVK